MALAIDDVRWVAHLARLDLPEDELVALAHDLAAIVAYVDQLQQVNTDGIEPLAHAVELSDVFRDDEPAPSLPLDQALANAPERKGDFYAVPAVLD